MKRIKVIFSAPEGYEDVHLELIWEDICKGYLAGDLDVESIEEINE